jgi:hypothetical protein
MITLTLFSALLYSLLSVVAGVFVYGFYDLAKILMNKTF